MSADATVAVAPPRACPRCTFPLVAVSQGGAEVDHCHRCGGVFVEPGRDACQLGSWANPGIWMGQLAEQVTGERLVCAGDGGTMAAYRVSCGESEVVVDHCGSCGALWLDYKEAGLLAKIVRQARSQKQLTPQGFGPTDDVGLLSTQELIAAQDETPPPGAGYYLLQLFTFMPLEVWNPVYGKARITRTLVWSMIGIAVLQLGYLATLDEKAAGTWLMTWGLVPTEITAGRQLWGLITSGFLHAGIAHLLGNMWFLWIFGDNVEDRVGPRRFVLLYTVALLAAGIVHTVATGGSLPCIGASGAIAGIMGAYMVLFPRVKLWQMIFVYRVRLPVWFCLGLFLAMDVLLGLFDTEARVAHWAHVGGFVAGLAMGFWLRRGPHPMAPAERSARAGRRL